MSGEALGWARRQKVSGGFVAKAVLLLLADYCGENHDCWPSVPTLAAEMQTHPRTIQRALVTLEADRLIEREARTTGSGKTTSNRIMLDVICERGGVVRGGAAPPVPPAERHPGGGGAPPSPPAERHPHMNHHLKPPIEPSFADAQDASARAEAGEAVIEAKIEAEFERFMGAYPQSGREKTSWAKARTAFVEQLPAAYLFDPGPAEPGDVLVACATTYAASATLAKGSFGAVNAVEFLAGERWRSFLPGSDAAQAVAQATAAPPRFADGAVRLAVADAKGAAFVANYLDPAEWDADARVLTPRTGVAARALRNDVGRLLAGLDVTIKDRGA